MAPIVSDSNDAAWTVQPLLLLPLCAMAKNFAACVPMMTFDMIAPSALYVPAVLSLALRPLRALRLWCAMLRIPCLLRIEVDEQGLALDEQLSLVLMPILMLL